uniref:Uncharacterized protein n=1 Tax=Rhizophora mucronata TaxID=61149 RepID=A0A2P2N2V3_RHIMU
MLPIDGEFCFGRSAKNQIHCDG